MLGCLPTLQPDELLYSVAARREDLLRFPTAEGAAREVFGLTKTNILVPMGLDYFIANLPPGHTHTINSIINGHTMLPLYAPFMPPAVVESTKVYVATGAMADNQCSIVFQDRYLPHTLRLCHDCVREDRERCGRAYWHRVHQAPGVLVCPVHTGTWLSRSHVGIRRHGKHCRKEDGFISCERALYEMPPGISEMVGAPPLQLRRIAADIQWLLSHNPIPLDHSTLRARYVALLHERSLATPGGVLRLTQIERAVQDYYSDEILTLLDCQLHLASEGKTKTWINLLFHSHTSHSPLQHLLLIQFLEQTPETFFADQPSATRKPFGDGPWPCLNPVADHRGELIVEQLNIQSQLQDKAKLIGTFICTCGFVYARREPNRTDNDRYQFDFVRFYGPVWDQALRTMWDDDTMIVQEIADALGVNYGTILRQGARLNLLFPRRCLRSVRDVRALRKLPGPKRAKWLSKRQTYRQRWLDKRKAQPELGRQGLRDAERPVYVWLMQHDHHWLQRHMPDKRSGGKKHNPSATHEARDA